MHLEAIGCNTGLIIQGVFLSTMYQRKVVTQMQRCICPCYSRHHLNSTAGTTIETIDTRLDAISGNHHSGLVI